MTATVTLTVETGGRVRQTLTLTERTTCVVGRARDCRLRIGADGDDTDSDDSEVSRHHCRLDVDPPEVRVRDLGSLNGTYVNGQRIGGRQPASTPADGTQEFPERDLASGDRLTVGRSTLVVVIASSCDGCGAAVDRWETLCDGCRERAAEVEKWPRCGRCGREVPDEDHRGEQVCPACRGDVGGLLARLLGLARAGDRRLLPLRDYELVEELGRGGQGVVHLARHVATGERVALKLLLPQVAVHPGARSAFLREMANVRALRHRHVVAFRDSGYAGSVFYFTSEYCDQGNVGRLAAEQGGRVPVDEALRIIGEVLAGLDHAHHAPLPAVRLAAGHTAAARGLVHRDVKPPNILLAGAARTAKIGDFGLAKAFDLAGLSGHTRTGTAAGTVAFMSRTQLVDYRYARPEVDVWGAAASLYWMLTGTTPRAFPPGADPVAVVLSQRPVPIRDRRPDLPHRLATIIDEALVDQPRIVVTSAAELRRALQDAA